MYFTWLISSFDSISYWGQSVWFRSDELLIPISERREDSVIQYVSDLQMKSSTNLIDTTFFVQLNLSWVHKTALASDSLNNIFYNASDPVLLLQFFDEEHCSHWDLCQLENIWESDGVNSSE